MGANDPIYLANTPMSDELVAALTMLQGLMLGDRSGGMILQDPVIAASFENWSAFGALASQKVALGWGKDKMQTRTESNAAVILTLDSDKSSLSLANKAFARKLSDRARFYDAWGVTEWLNFFRDGEWSFGQTVVDVIAALAASITAIGGNTGGNDSWGCLFDDVQTLSAAGVAGPYVCLETEKQWGKLAKDSLTVGGAVQMDPETLRYMAQAGYKYKGTFMAGNVSIYTSDELDVSAGDTLGMMFGREFLRWSAGCAPKSPAAIEIGRTPLWSCEIGRTVLKSEDDVVTQSEIGAAIHINAAGIQRPFLT